MFAPTSHFQVSAFDPARLRKPCPAGDYLLIRGLYVPNDPKEGPLKKLNACIAAIRETATGDLKKTLLLTASLSHSDKNSTTCTVCLDPVHGYDNGEPRVDLLQLWANAIADDNTFWEVAWAPQPDGCDKRMWARVADVFKKEGERSARDYAAEAKVISALHDDIDFAGFTTIDAFHLGVSKHVMIVLAKPVEADALIGEGCVVIDSKTYCIEVLAPFEIVVTGFRWSRTEFNLTPPTLLYRYNAGSTRQSVHATVAARAELTKDAISTLNHRIDINECDARARNADMKENALSLQLAQIDSDAANARQELRHPIDEEERQATLDLMVMLKITRTDVSSRLAALHGKPGALLTAPGPVISPPMSLTIPATPVLNKRPRTSTDGPDADSSDMNRPIVADNRTDTDLDDCMELALTGPGVLVKDRN
ncbi:hypothetical protein B0H13DRAFT_2008338 [Mycena leptocephala]|nr:hypothetical protein B0H13DRAFT_2008338 [Mycena leptocephala]